MRTIKRIYGIKTEKMMSGNLEYFVIQREA